MNLIRKRLLPGVMALFLAVPALAQEDGLPIYLNTAYSFEERATDLVSRLTLEEKQSLLGNNMAAVPRLGLKNYNVWSEALHGVLSGARPEELQRLERGAAWRPFRREPFRRPSGAVFLPEQRGHRLVLGSVPGGTDGGGHRR